MIDLRSDTVTKPTPEMRQAIAQAEVGDDVYGEDPSVIALEEQSSRLLGKEASMFIPSGTMGNLSALLTHCPRGSEIILGDRSHIFLNEVGGGAALGGIQPHILPNQADGTIELDDIRSAVRSRDIHHPFTRLIALENTQNMCGGVAITPDYTQQVGNLAREYGLKLHLDGARLFNASTTLDCDPAELVAAVDSVMFCLSKGLGAPVGSVLCGEHDFITRARGVRKMLGGAMRQAGLIAAGGLFALQNHLPLLQEDHRRAKELASGLKDIPHLSLVEVGLPTNMVYLYIDTQHTLSAEELKERLRKRGILIGFEREDLIRLVTHLWINDSDVEKVIQAFHDLLK